jgi:hypothetical protein
LKSATGIRVTVFNDDARRIQTIRGRFGRSDSSRSSAQSA